MNQIRIADSTLCKKNNRFTFKEKIEISRYLERLSVDIVEFPEIENPKADILLIRTVSSFVKKSSISVAAGIGKNSIENAIAALSSADKPIIRIALPLSPVGMEYTCHMKAPAMLEYVKESISAAKAGCDTIEFCAMDATRTEPEFLKNAIEIAENAGATSISICDNAANMLPDDFAAFAKTVKSYTSLPVGVACDNKNGLAIAQAILAVKEGIDTVKTAVDGETVSLEGFCEMIKNCGNDYGFTVSVKTTELHRNVKQIRWVTDSAQTDHEATVSSDAPALHLDINDDKDAVIFEAQKLGYDLSDEDQEKVYEEFLRVAEKKKVGYKELEAIIASVALSVPSTYKLINYVINTGNIITASAQITLEKDGNTMQGVSIGDGAIDAAFLAIDQIIGHHYELDDFQIQSVTEGKEAMGSALVKLRANGKLYSGNGISTDIIGASIRAYISAVNKIVYKEA